MTYEKVKIINNTNLSKKFTNITECFNADYLSTKKFIDGLNYVYLKGVIIKR
jgi:hypothetical protein